MKTLWLDTETFSATPIGHGTYRYTETCEPMIVTYAIDDGPVKLIDMTLDLCEDWWVVQDLCKGADRIIAHNAMFDRNVLARNLIYPIATPIEKWRCCMVKALAHGLPGGLEKLCDILNVGQDKAKHKDGKSLIHLFCKPQPKNMKLRRATRKTHPDEWQRFCDYAMADIDAMREVWNRLPSWNYGEEGIGKTELDLWHLDQKINDRGVLVDMGLVDAAIRATDDEQARLRKQINEATDGYVGAATQRDRLLEYLFMQHGIGLADLTGATVSKMLEKGGLDPDVRELLTIRDQASQSSTSKYKAFKKATSADGRLRGMLQFDGAARTRRDAGRTVQLQNLPSRGLLPQHEIDLGIEALMLGCEDMLFDNVMLLTASTIRASIVAPPKKKLVISDLANIEGRDLAWLAGEEWKLQAFRDFDTIIGYDAKGEPIRKGHDLYKLAYAKAFQILPEEVTKFGRSVGKVMELGLGYAGGINAFVTFALVYGIDLEEMANTAWPTLPEDKIEEARDFIEWLEGKGNKWPMSNKAVIVCEVFKRMWREAHPMTVQLWAELEDGFRKACGTPGKTFAYRGFRFRRDGAWLRIKLPSGRYLCYPHPQIADDGQLSYMGVNQFTKKWERIKTYGGRLTENCIAEGTPVLTLRGWVPIEQVQADDRLWDGVEWVTSAGCVYRGNQAVLQAFGVSMTPDHQVLTTKGWVHASSCEGHIRAPCRLPDGCPVSGQQREKIAVGGALRLRDGAYPRTIGDPENAETGGSCVVRMHEGPHAVGEEADTRHVPAPRLRRLAEHGRPVQVAYASGVAQLWCAWHTGLQTVAGGLRKLLGRHGPHIPQRPNARTCRQHGGLPSGELSVERPQSTGQQHPPQPMVGDSDRAHDRNASRRGLRDRVLDTTIPPGQQLAGEADVRAVWDIQDCGPRQRFVVKGPDGLPLIVHNCCQSVARDFMFDSMAAIEQAGYEIIVRVHDELPTEAPDTDDFNPEHLSSLLATNPPWAPDMPLAAAGFQAYRYGKD